MAVEIKKLVVSQGSNIEGQWEFMAQNRLGYQLFKEIKQFNSRFALLNSSGKVIQIYSEFNKAWLGFAYSSTKDKRNNPKEIHELL